MILENNKHMIIPIMVGIIIDRIVHFRLFVSFLMVRMVVTQGK